MDSNNEYTQRQFWPLFSRMGLSDEMVKNGWVTQLDEDTGLIVTYNRDFMSKLLSSEPTVKPKETFKGTIIDLNE
jgi:hypothetical protein